MFRLLRLKPPHGWKAVAWELAIVTLGVVIALGAQQWAEGLDWSGKVAATKRALRAELQEHYGYAVEYRMVYPCLAAQVARLKERVLVSGSEINPAPMFSETDGSHYVIRLPSKLYPSDAWETAVADGTIRSLDPTLRRQLAGHYAQTPEMWEITSANNAAEPALVALTHPLPLDPAVRYSIVKDLEQMRGRLEYLDLLNGQLIENIQKAGMLPPTGAAQAVAERYGTYRFCKAHKLPMRPFTDAMRAVAN
jgi:hypothetical protein